ncbi:MAG: hypothetical protein VX181_18805, partial [Pseudomonadota bacterium]|nr:hypothetical protein [Pseudomonadota bacterium]
NRKAARRLETSARADLPSTAERAVSKTIERAARAREREPWRVQGRAGTAKPMVVFGPTCDSIDRLPEPVELPDALQEGDYVLFDGMGAYSLSLATDFNGYGLGRPITVASLSR